MAKCTFTIGQVVSITDGSLMCEIGEVYEILNFLTGENLFTYQLPRAAKAAGPVLLKRLPQLSEIDLKGKVNKNNYSAILADLIDKYGATFELEPLGPGDYGAMDPFAEPILARTPSR